MSRAVAATIDPDDLQIVFADLQPSVIASSGTVAPDAIACAAGKLAAAAALIGLPMTFLTVGNETGPTALVPDLVRHATAQTCIARHLTGPFLVPDIVGALAGYDRQTLMIAGFSAETAVLQTALRALAAGYTVYVPADCTGSRAERTERGRRFSRD